MDEKIKNFDRSIEKMMNETAVTPPFGMWNRISAGLDAEVLPVAAAAPLAVAPKRPVVALVTGALILGGSLLMAYLISNKTLLQEEATSEVPETIVPYIEHAEPEVVIINEVQPAVIPAAVIKRTVVAKPVVTEVVKEETPVVQNYAGNNYNEVAVPDQMQAQSTGTVADTYYFPPVDANSAIAANAESKAKAIDEEEDGQQEVTEKKTKVYSSSREKKLRPKKKRTGGFTYGRINRYRDPK